MTLQDAIDRAREILQDQVEEYRYTEEELIAYFNQALNQARRVRPDLFLRYIGYPTPVYTTNDLNTNLPISFTYFDALVFYMAGYAEMRDDEHTVSQRSTSLITAFNAMLRGAAA